MERDTASGKCRILNPKTLRGRLSLGYAAALIIALTVFAGFTLEIVDRAQRSALDAELQSLTGALRVIGDVRGSHFVVDATDRAQFFAIVGAKAQSAILSADRSIVVATDAGMARELTAVVPRFAVPAFADVAAGHEQMRVYVSPIRNGQKMVGETIAWDDADAIGTLDRSVALAFAIVIPFLALVAIVAGGEIARRGLAPLERIVALASEIEGHDLSRRLGPPARHDELGRLAATFDRMLDRLQSAFERERRFASDASHELRAPLSVIRAEADLALRQERSPEAYRQALETIASESDALEALTRDLLLAARNGSNVEDVRAPVDLGLVATTVVERLSVIAGSRSVRVVDAGTGAAVVRANPALIERAVLCVLHNALKFSPESANVEIRLSSADQTVELMVRDDGPGFSKKALERGFDRFWRDDEVRSSEGSGLGLSLAKTIVQRYDGTIVLANAAPHGAVVRMTFPAQSVCFSDT